MIIEDWRSKINSPDLFLILVVVLAGSLGFGLGRLSKLESSRTPIRIETPAAPVLAGESGSALPSTGPKASPAEKAGGQGQVVVSKNSTKYHLPTCAGAKAIKEENKIWFASAEEASRAGYEPAANCPGL